MKNIIIKLLKQNIILKKILVTGNSNHITILAVGNIFTNMSTVKRQQLIYSPLTHLISEKHIHAITINTFSPKEWEKNKNININEKNS